MLSIFVFFTYGYFGVWVFPVLSIFGGSVVNLISIATYGDEIRLLGASGLVYFLGAWWLTMYFFIQRQYSLPNRILRLIGIALMVFFPTSFVPTTSYRTHAIGFLCGAVFALIYFYIYKQSIRSYEKYKVIEVEAEHETESPAW